MNKYFLTCPRGLEEITSNQISKYIKSTPIIDLGGVKFQGNKEDMYNVNLNSRTGMHLLKEIYSFNINTEKDIYKNIYNFSWDSILNPNKTFIIRTKSKSKIFQNTNFFTLKIKDAIVDNIRSKFGKRPSINKIDPDIILLILIKDKKITVYIDSSGSPLFKRGYRSKIHKASLNESLAAGLILLSNWDRKSPFYDLMCGSGTIPIEAAMIAYNIPAGIFRNGFGFQKWDNYDKNLWDEILVNAKEGISLNDNIPIYGSDYFQKNIELGRESSRQMNISQKINFQSLDIKDFKPLENNGIIIINPPYGNRIGEEKIIQKLYKNIGDIFKTYCVGFDAYIFTGNLEAIKSIGLRSKKRIILKNGKIDCRLLHYPITVGKFK
tara:strand:- start:7056 stop:8195 length:1140 start_codon:yes stop_codon:yes gene_type:complete